MEQDKFDVLVIGAGAAGLMAAWELTQVNKRVALIEARDRVGGRIHTIEDARFSMPIEVGAEFIHGNLKLTKRLLEKGKIPSYEVGGDIWRKEDHGLEREKDFIDDYRLLNKKFKLLDRDMPVADFLNMYFKEPEYEEVRTSLKTYVEGYYAADTTRASTFALREELQKADEEQYRVEGGYGKLIRFLVGELEKRGCIIVLSSPVQTINWQKNQVVVQTTKSTYYGTKLLLTVPVGVLQAGRPTFFPAIPHKIEAARALGFGPVIKLILQFKSAFWKEKESTGNKNLDKAGFIFSEETVPTWWTQYPKEVPILVGWLGGPNAERFKNLSEEDILQKALDALGHIFNLQSGVLKKDLVHATLGNWATDPYCCGGYSYDVVDGKRQKQLLKEPVEGTIFFAGEGLYEGLEIGTVEAALVNGREVAHQLIASF
jgi:monoamine oxidase